MANQKISALPAAAALDGTELYAGVQAAANVKITGSQIKTLAQAGTLLAANNLSDVGSAATSRTNLGVTATGADTTYNFRANNLSDVANAGTARTNLGLAIGTNVEAWSAELDGLAALAGTGLVAHTAAGTYVERTLTGTANRISVTNGGGVAGNPTLDIAATYVGQTSITTLGTIGTGTWQGTLVAAGFGGTGSAFTQFTGTSVSIKTFTLPNASANILTDNALVTVAQGGTGRGTLTNHGVLVGAGTAAITQLVVGTTDQVLLGASAADPVFTTLTGDVTISAGVTGIGANKVTNAMIRQGVARSVVGVTGNATANVADIQGAASTVLQVNAAGTALTFAALDISTAAVTGILAAGNGGTASAFTAFTGPATSIKTFTLPNASATILTDNARVTVAQGGTGLGTLTAHALQVGNGTSNVTQLAVGTTDQVLLGATGADPVFTTLTGDITISAGVTALGSNVVSNAKFRQGVARSVVGVTGNATANVADIQGGASTVLQVNAAGTALTFTALDVSTAAVTGTLAVGNGGTGRATLTNHSVLIGAAAGAITQSAVGATGTVLHGNTGADPTFSAVNLAADVTGLLPVANVTGGVGNTAFTPTLSFATPGSSSFAYTTQLGSYAQIGNIIIANYQITATFTLGTASGNLQVSLPVNSANTGQSMLGNVSTTMPLHNALDTVCHVFVGSSAAIASFRSGRNGVQDVAIVAADLTSIAYTITATLVYQV